MKERGGRRSARDPFSKGLGGGNSSPRDEVVGSGIPSDTQRLLTIRLSFAPGPF